MGGVGIVGGAAKAPVREARDVADEGIHDLVEDREGSGC